MSIALDRLRQDLQAEDAEKANPQYENGLNALKMLNKIDYDEIRTFRQPPQPVLAVMNTICIMFHRKPEYSASFFFEKIFYLFIFRWSEAKILMVKENFFEDLVFYDKDNVPDDVFNMLTKIVNFDTFRPSIIATSSKAAAGLCSWILAVYEYAKIARSQRTKLEQVKAYQELYNKVFSYSE
jgi:dynein heavy chain